MVVKILVLILMSDGLGWVVVHCCTLFLCYLDAEIDDQYRNPNINNRDHLVGQLTTSTGTPALPVLRRLPCPLAPSAQSNSALKSRPTYPSWPLFTLVFC